MKEWNDNSAGVKPGIFEVQKDFKLIHYHLENEIDIPDLNEKVPITLVSDPDPDELISFVMIFRPSSKPASLLP